MCPIFIIIFLAFEKFSVQLSAPFVKLFGKRAEIATFEIDKIENDDRKYSSVLQIGLFLIISRCTTLYQWIHCVHWQSLF